jgi:hypothetical protein
MRRSWYPGFFVLTLLAVATWASPSPARSRARAADRPAAEPAAPEPREVFVVDGYGRSPELARKVALENGEAKVVDLLRGKFGQGQIVPSASLRADALRQNGVLVPLGEPQADGLGSQRYKARVQVELTSTFIQEVQSFSREARSKDRHLLLGRMLAAVVVMLLVFASYLRLEDATRGYYTWMLRLGAGAIVGFAVLLLWGR